MKKVKIKRIKGIFNSIEKYDIDEAYSKIKREKFDKAKTILEENNIEDSMIRFSNAKKEDILTKDIKTANKLLKILKILYSVDIILVSDEIYDPFLRKYKKFRKEPIVEVTHVNRRTTSIEHIYPELKGTLNKANKIYDSECEKDTDISVESFIRECMSNTRNIYVKYRFSYKYDGNSLVASIIDDRIDLGVTRGDDDKGIDLTHLFKNLVFTNRGICGVQFEIMMSYKDFESYKKKRNKSYANTRSAVTSIITSSDGAKYSKYLSLVPLKATNVSYKDAEELNEKFADGIDYEYIEIEGSSIKEVMDAFHAYVMSIQRDDLGYAIDGVVIECLDDDVREAMGRKDDIDRFSIAYKFPPMVRYTTVQDISVTVGRTGLVTPMVNYFPVEFNGTIHNKSTLSSYERYKNMDLVKGEQIGVSYNNDVMPYPFKIDNEGNRELHETEKPIPFPLRCKCGSKFEKFGANYYCTNPGCREKLLAKYEYFYDSLGVRDFKQKKIQRLIKEGIITDITSLLTFDIDALEDIDGFSVKTIKSLKKQFDFLKNNPIDEAKLVSALSIIGERTARSILSIMPLSVIFSNPNRLLEIKIDGIEIATKEKFIKALFCMKDAVDFYRDLLHVNEVKLKDDMVKICFSGFRDKNLKMILESLGFEVVDSVTKKIKYLVIPDSSFTSNSVEKANKYRKYGVEIITLSQLHDKIKEL